MGRKGRLGGWSALNQPLVKSQSNGFQAAVNLQLPQDILDMIPDGRRTDEEAITDGGCAHALGQMAEDGKLPAAQRRGLLITSTILVTRSGLKGKFRNWLR